MLAACIHLDFDPHGYARPEHPLQRLIARLISETCGIGLDQSRMGIDGCSVPTWAAPLRALARGFARLGTGEGLTDERARAAKRLVAACFASPVMVAGEGRFDTLVMSKLAPSVFVKGGAEGVHCAALPGLGLGVAVKVDDGAKRGAERALAETIAALLPQARAALADQLAGEIVNWRGTRVGRIAASPELQRALGSLAALDRGDCGVVTGA